MLRSASVVRVQNFGGSRDPARGPGVRCPARCRARPPGSRPRTGPGRPARARGSDPVGQKPWPRR
ncbi:hypothetical protein CIK68_15545 [Brachybacterium alimentarium]|nr:hypothetical protein CIK68_15545 [Brachybacterium alimentarium]